MNEQKTNTRIVIFAKAPITGQAKTRLSPALGMEGAANLARELLRHCVTEALAAQVGPVELCVAPSVHHPIWRDMTIPDAVQWSEQGEGDLGARLARAAQRVTLQGEAVLLIGTDCPDLSAAKLRDAAQVLERHHACMVPVSDGGYALLGLQYYHSSFFSNIPWSTDKVAQLTRQRLFDQGIELQTLPMLHDIDEPSDLQYLPTGLLIKNNLSPKMARASVRREYP